MAKSAWLQALRRGITIDVALNPSIQRQPLSVLAVEDDPAVAQAVALVLRDSRCSIMQAANAEEALAAIARHRRAFDVVITDNSMPGGCGRDLVRRLRQDSFQGKIVVLSAYVSAEDEAEYRDLGVDAMVQKPFAVAELREAVGL